MGDYPGINYVGKPISRRKSQDLERDRDSKHREIRHRDSSGTKIMKDKKSRQYFPGLLKSYERTTQGAIAVAIVRFKL